MAKSLSSYLKLLFVSGDLLILNTAYIFSALVLNTSESIVSEDSIIKILVINCSWIFLSLLLSPYKFSRISSVIRILRVHLALISIHILAVISVLVIIDPRLIEVVSLSTMFLVSTVLLVVWRMIYFYLNNIVLNRRLNFKNVVIVGFGDLALEMRKFFRLHPEYGYRFLGYFDQNIKTNEVNYLDNFDEFCRNNNVHEIYCCLPYLDSTRVKSLVDFGLSNLIKVKLITDYRGFFGRGVSLERYNNIPVLNVAAIPLDERRNQVIKRIFDLVFSAFVVVFILSWLVPIVGLLIKLDSKGPIFFKQKRAGKGNRPFNCLKFRTMIVHQHDFVQATKGDSRITGIGQFLRKTSLDEFPQFINVLKGEMSIIGPRPHPLKLNEEYNLKIEKFMARHYIKPGITGLAQSKGFRGETRDEFSMKNRVKLDRFYIENWSFLLDLKIIIATVVSMAKGDQNAY